MAEIYRSIRPDDFDALFAIAQQWQVVRQLGGWKWPPDPDQIRDRSRPYDGDGFVWAICRDDRLIGTIGAIRGDIGYVLHPDWHGQGIMTRAVIRAITQSFVDTTRDHLEATTWHDNVASHTLLTKLGFVQWQTCYQQALARGLPTLSRHYRLTRQDWQTLEKPAAIA